MAKFHTLEAQDHLKAKEIICKTIFTKVDEHFLLLMYFVAMERALVSVLSHCFLP
eukprot:c27673_g2_i2 orf=48-212(-)